MLRVCVEREEERKERERREIFFGKMKFSAQQGNKIFKSEKQTIGSSFSKR